MPFAGFLPASRIVPPWIPALFLLGLSQSTHRTYISEVKGLFLYVMQLGLPWPTPLTVQLIANYCIYAVLTRNRSACSVSRIMAIVSRLADSHPAYAAPRTESDSRLIRRLRRFLLLQRPLAPKGRDAIPNPAAFVPLMLAHLTASPEDEAFLARFLLLLNTGMRCAETNWHNMRLSDVAVAFDAAGRVLYIVFYSRFSKTNKTSAAPVLKFIFPRLDALDAVRPLLRYLRHARGINPSPTLLAPGEQPPALGSHSESLFPCLAPGHSPMYQAGGDTTAMTERMKALAILAGMPEKEAQQQGVHGFRSTLTTLIVQAGGDAAFAERVIGWNARKHQSANRYLRAAADHSVWLRMNTMLTSFLSKSAASGR